MSGAGRPGKHSAWCVHVAGLSRGAVHRYDNGITEEDNLGWFFYHRGCDVKDVRLLVDQNSNRSRGFGYVDFGDEESYKKALSYDGTEHPENVKLEPSSRGLKVAGAIPTAPSLHAKQRELSNMRDTTDSLLQTIGYRLARITELTRQIENQRHRQSRIAQGRDIEQLMEEEQQLQESIRTHDRQLAAQEAELARQLPHEEERTRALEELMLNVDDERSRRHADTGGGEACGAPAARLSLVAEPPPAPSPEPGAAGAEQAPPAAGDEGGGNLPDALDDMEPMLRIKNTFIELYRPPCLMRQNTAPARQEFAGDLTPASSPGAPPSAPWQLTRQASITSRAILEEKMSVVNDDAAAANVPPAEDRPGTHVRITNLPSSLRDDELEAELREELARLWRDVRGRGGPGVASVSRRSPTEAAAVLASADDAKWLVEGRDPQNWTSSQTLRLRGQVLRAEWAAAAAPGDFRQLKARADTDASSHVSYGTAGTLLSRPGPQGPGGHDGGHPGRAVAAGRVQRAVLVQGFGRSLTTHFVQSEVLALLRRLWERDGYPFSPQETLHRGEGGVEVRPGRGRDENTGTCLVRFRAYADAKWLVAQARGLSIGGQPVRALWARPRD